MAELINTKCRPGRLIITDTHIIVEGRLNSSVLPRSAFSTLQTKLAWFTGAKQMIFHGSGGERITANWVSAKDAKTVTRILTGRE